MNSEALEREALEREAWNPWNLWNSWNAQRWNGEATGTRSAGTAKPLERAALEREATGTAKPLEREALEPKRKSTPALVCSPPGPYLCPMAVIGRDVNRAAELLEQGRLVAIPTETVYGLAANALDEEAVLGIFEAKQRPFFDPLIVHVPDLASVHTYASLDEPRLKKLAEKFWPGPLTLLLPKKPIIPDLVTSGLPQVGIRVPDQALTRQLLQSLTFPLAAPSANPFGYVSPTSPQHVQKQLGHAVSYIIDGGQSRVGLESTIVGLEEQELCVYRLGGLSIEQIESVAGKLSQKLNVSSDPRAPGQLKNHYAPRKPLFLGDKDSLMREHSGKKIALISMGTKQPELKAFLHFNLSPSQDLHEAAVNLFHFLREADESEAELVIAEPVPEDGLGLAINDRLRRAAST